MLMPYQLSKISTIHDMKVAVLTMLTQQVILLHFICCAHSGFQDKLNRKDRNEEGILMFITSR